MLRRFQLTVGAAPGGSDIEQEVEYANTYWSLVVSLMAHHAWSDSDNSECMPYVSSGIVDASIGKAKATMANVRLLYHDACNTCFASVATRV